jgi:hypothetical protein
MKSISLKLKLLLPTLSLSLVIISPRGHAATVGWWRFEEGTPGSAAAGPNSVLDYSGNGLHATPTGGPVYSTDLSPWAGAIGSTRSLQFNGWTTGLFVPDRPSLQLQSLTIEAFFKTEPMLAGTGAVADLLMRGDNRPGLDPYGLSLSQPGNGLQFFIGDAANNTAALNYTVPFDQWIFAAATFDAGTGDMRLYVNGQLVRSTTTSVRPFGGLDPSYSPGLGIGSDQTGQYGQHLNGWLDEVRLSDTALDPSQFLVPEPSALALFGCGAIALACFRRCKTT